MNKIFNDALAGVLKIPSSDGLFFSSAQIVAEGIRQGQRFIVPYGGGAISGRPFRDYFGEMNLPYETTVVGAESLGIDTTDFMRWVIVCRQMKGEIGFNFVACVSINGQGERWVPLPPSSVRANEKGGLEIGIYDLPSAREWCSIDPDMKPSEIFGPIVSSVVNLCVLLAAHNVRAETVSVAPAVNAKRKQRGNLPLYSYKVLNVAGERWDTNGSDDGDGHGYRSHLRRGHIRRLSDDRVVWVRATFVHGREPGFVDKDYNVLAPA